MDQIEYYSPCFIQPSFKNMEELLFKKKFNLKYEELKKIESISSKNMFTYEHFPTNRMFIYNTIYKNWEELD